MIKGKMTAFEYFVKQLDYQAQTLEIIYVMKKLKGNRLTILLTATTNGIL
jgi:hypothetical protein